MSSQMMSQNEKLNLINTFKALDKDGDGTLSRKELVEGFKNINMSVSNVEDYVDKIICSIDNNNSGIIDFTEFCIACSNQEAIMSQEKVKAAFQMFDADGNGKISAKEMHKMMAGINIKDIAEMMKQADSNGDGEIDFEEFS